MRRTFALIIAVVVALMAAPAIGGNPNAVDWVETDVMGNEIPLTQRVAGDWLHLRYERHGRSLRAPGTTALTVASSDGQRRAR